MQLMSFGYMKAIQARLSNLIKLFATDLEPVGKVGQHRAQGQEYTLGFDNLGFENY